MRVPWPVALPLVVGTNNGPVQRLVNDIANRSWVGVRLTGRDTPRDMLGARAGITRPDGRTYWRRARSDGGYASANGPRILVGLGAAADITRVTVRWPDATEETWDGIPADQWGILKEGSGRDGGAVR